MSAVHPLLTSYLPLGLLEGTIRAGADIPASPPQRPSQPFLRGKEEIWGKAQSRVQRHRRGARVRWEGRGEVGGTDSVLPAGPAFCNTVLFIDVMWRQVARFVRSLALGTKLI